MKGAKTYYNPAALPKKDLLKTTWKSMVAGRTIFSTGYVLKILNKGFKEIYRQ